jgi:hypothetical protein
MTVGDMIALLSAFPADAELVRLDQEYCTLVDPLEPAVHTIVFRPKNWGRGAWYKKDDAKFEKTTKEKSVVVI